MSAIIQRYSKKREAILESLKGTKTHPSAEWIYLQLKPIYSDLSMGTVYRNLQQLKEERIIKSIATVKGNERYDYDISEHPHFICEKCGKVLDLITQGTYIDHSAFKNNNVLIKSYELILKGQCEDCIEK